MRLWPFFAVVVLMLFAVESWAQPASPTGNREAPLDASEALIRKGIELRRKGEDEQALPYFQKAVSILASPRALAQLGLAEYSLGHWANAEDHLARALAANQDPWITTNRATLERSLAEVSSRFGSLELSVNVTGARLIIDGEPKGKLPLGRPLRLVMGTYSVEVQHPDYYPFLRRVRVNAGEVARETVELQRLSGTVRPVPATRASPPDDSGFTRSPSEFDQGTRFGTLKWVSLGASGAFLLFSGATALIREGEVSSYNDDPDCPGAASASQPEECDGRLSRGKTLRTLSIVGLATGIVLGGISGTLFVADGSKKQLACHGGEQTLSVTCRARF